MAMKPDAENKKTAENPMFSTVDASGATRVRTEDPLLAKHIFIRPLSLILRGFLAIVKRLQRNLSAITSKNLNLWACRNCLNLIARDRL